MDPHSFVSVIYVWGIHVVAEGEALLLCSFQLLLGLFFSRKARISWHAIGVFAAT